jgi:hypothetical protein
MIVDHCVKDENKTWTIVPYVPYNFQFLYTMCERMAELHEYAIYNNYNDPCSPVTDSTSSDPGLQCYESVNSYLTLDMRSGLVTEPTGGTDTCHGACGVPPPSGFIVRGSDETLQTFMPVCEGPYVVKLLQLQATVLIESETLPTGEEFLINGTTPSSIYQESLDFNNGLYGWQGTLQWDVPINVSCNDKITLTSSVVNGYGQGTISYIKVTSIVGLIIIRPLSNSDFDLTQSNHLTTQPINYQAHAIPVGAASAVDWGINVQYRTSGGKCTSCDVTQTFQSAPDVDYPETYSSMGGQVIGNASAVIQGETVTAEPVIYTITGVSIPPNDITDRLVSLYKGTTKRLMTGLAMKESTYMQFSQRTLYGVTDLWPRESYDGGSHIGLMQVEPTMQRAWDWLENTRYGVNFFWNDKMSIAKYWEGKIKNEAKTNYKCQLRNLTGVERENMALILYGPEASPAITGQYYYYQATTSKGKTTCEWVKNTQGNLGGVAYADDVRAKMQ